jgi:TRAP-type C4-dicarboxylate transport system substrate-binding protein
MLRPFVVLALVLGLAAAPASAQTVTLKLGTLAPEGSSWHTQLKDLAAAWNKASGGKVVLKIFAGGVAGSEGDMVRKMRVGQLHAAAISAIGLGDIDRTPSVLSTPGLLTSDEEFRQVYVRYQPRLEKLLDDKGYQVLLWGDTGAVHLFSRRPFKAPADLAGLKTAAWAGDPGALEAFKLTGFQPVTLSSTDIFTSLTTGMIDAYANTPVMALAARWYERTPYMSGLAWGHLPGATIVTKQAWEKVPAALRPELLRLARELAAKVDGDLTRMQADAVAAMKKNGLTVVEFDAAGREAWQKLGERAWPAVRGGVVAAAEFDEVKRIRDEYRAGPK